MPQKAPIFFHNASGDIEDVIVTLESTAKAAVLEISTVAAAEQIATRRMRRASLRLFYAIVASRRANHSWISTAGKTRLGLTGMILRYGR